MSLVDKFSLLGLALTVVALTATLLQFRLARKQRNDLRKISDSMSTRYLGSFPDYLHHVVNLLDSAESSIEIIVGNPTPAYFSSKKIWVSYKQVIERKAHDDLDITIICSSEEQRKKRLLMQFPTNEDEWLNWIPKYSDILDEFLRNSNINLSGTCNSQAELLDLLIAVQNRELCNTFKIGSINLREVNSLISVQVWIVDKSQAIFAIQTQTASNSAMSYGLHTADAQFVKALRCMFALYN